MTNRREMNNYIRHLHLKQQGMKRDVFINNKSEDFEKKRTSARELANKINFLEELRKEMIKIEQEEARCIKSKR